MKTFFSSAALLFMFNFSSAEIIYVNYLAGGLNNGNNWTNAYTDLQDALTSANSGDDIWVAAGTYKPTTGNNREAFFSIPSGVRMYGGFDGTETLRFSRNWNENPTLISGYIGDVLTSTDNSKMILFAESGSDETLVDGFTIEGAYNEGGAVIQVTNVDDFTFKHCIFRENHSDGLFHHYLTSNIIEYKDCLFYYNTGSADLIAASTEADITMINVTITENVCQRALYSNFNASLRLFNSIVYNNDASQSILGVTEARFGIFDEGNLGIILPEEISTANPDFVNPDNINFSLQNVSPAIGAGSNEYTSQGLDLFNELRISGENVDLGCYEKRVNTTIYVDSDATGFDNGADWANAFNKLEDAFEFALAGDDIWVAEGIYFAQDPNNTDQQFLVPDGIRIKGGFAGIETEASQSNAQIYPTILSADIGVLEDDTDNSLRIMYLENTEMGVTLDGLIFQSLNSPEYALHLRTVTQDVESKAIVKNCVFRLNNSSFASSCVRTDILNTTEGSTDLTLENCLFYHNLGNSVASCAFGSSKMTFTGCTFTENQLIDVQVGTVFGTPGDEINIYNSIFWENNGSPMTSGGPSYDLAHIFFDNGNSSETVIFEDPLFELPSQLDFRLKDGSPGIGFGNNDYVNSGKDLGGEDRIQGNNVDIGCYESDDIFFGCMDDEACNYDPDAEESDGSCAYPGCINEAADNYNPLAGCSDGSCIFLDDIIYVDQDATGSGDGTSWENAYTIIGPAINSATSGTQIWIAEGTYTSNSNVREASVLLMINGVEFYGGFDGTETALDQRDFGSHQTIISGEIGSSLSSDNTLSLVTGSNALLPGIIDGFVFKDQYADIDQGDDVEDAAINVTQMNLDIRNCIFENNRGYRSGAIHMDGIAPKELLVSNCLFTQNESNFSSIIFGEGTLDVTMSNATVADNIYLGTPGDQLFNLFSGSSVDIYNTIISNSGTDDLVDDQNTLTISNSVFDVDFGETGTISDLIIADPNFVSSETGNYQLDVGSPAINHGDNELSYELYDLKGEIRIQDGIVDAGCFESNVSSGSCLGDANNDGTVDVVDLLAVSSNFGCLSNCTNGDANGDQVVNITDLLAVSSNFGADCP